jgi:hypothetical protein
MEHGERISQVERLAIPFGARRSRVESQAILLVSLA